MGLFYAFLHPQKHIRLHTSKNITRNPAELWDIKNRRVPNTRLLLSLVGVTGFEPATPCTPCKYSTRLSYTPTAHEYYYVQPQNTNTFLGKDAYCSFAAIFVYYNMSGHK